MKTLHDTTQRVFSVAKAIYRLPVETQQRVLILVNLLAEAPSPARVRAQRMIQNVLDGERVSPDRCLIQIDSAIDYLLSEQSIYEANDTVLSH